MTGRLSTAGAMLPRAEPLQVVLLTLCVVLPVVTVNPLAVTSSSGGPLLACDAHSSDNGKCPSRGAGLELLRRPGGLAVVPRWDWLRAAAGCRCVGVRGRGGQPQRPAPLRHHHLRYHHHHRR